MDNEDMAKGREGTARSADHKEAEAAVTKAVLTSAQNSGPTPHGPIEFMPPSAAIKKFGSQEPAAPDAAVSDTEDLLHELENALAHQARVETALARLLDDERRRDEDEALKLNEKERAAELLRQELAGERERSMTLGKILDTANSNLCQLEAKHQALFVSLEETRAQSAERASIAAKLESNLITEQEIRGKTEQEVESLKAWISREQEWSASLAEKAGLAESERSALQESSEDLKRLLEKLTADLDDQSKLSASTHEKLFEEQQISARLTKEIAELRSILAIQDDQAFRTLKALQETENQLTQKKDEIAALQMRLSQERQRSVEMEDELAERADRLQITLKEAQQKLAQAAVEKQVLQTDITRHVARFSVSIADQAKLTQNLGQELINAKSRIQTSEARVSQLEQILEAEKAASAKLSRYAEKAEARVMEVVASSGNLEEELARHQGQLQVILRGTSWRLTKPWRAHKRVLSKLRYILVRRKSVTPHFDPDWYLKQYPDVSVSEIDPYVHYLLHGATEGRDPNPFFDTDWYRQRYSDVKNAGVNPLIHFVMHGVREGRDPHPRYSNEVYRQKYRFPHEERKNSLLRSFGVFLRP